MPQMTPEEIDALARKRAGAKMGWYIHAMVYLLVNAFWFLSAAYAGRHWSPMPLFGWGLGLALHGISVFVLGTGSGLRERMIQQERDRLQREQQQRRES